MSNHCFLRVYRPENPPHDFVIATSELSRVIGAFVRMGNIDIDSHCRLEGYLLAHGEITAAIAVAGGEVTAWEEMGVMGDSIVDQLDHGDRLIPDVTTEKGVYIRMRNNTDQVVMEIRK